MSQISQQVGRSAVPKSASIQLAQEGAAVAGAGIAFAICSGVPALLMVLTAIGVGALAQRGQAPALDQALAVEHANHDVGVADIDGEEHIFQVTSPPTIRSTRWPTRTSSAPWI